MADVFRRVEPFAAIRVVFSAAALVKTVDWGVRLDDPAWFLLLWVPAAVALLAGRFVYLSAATIGVLSWVGFSMGVQNQHVWLLMWIPAFLILHRGGAPESALLTAARIQVSAVYFFAGFTKLTPLWLSGYNVRFHQTHSITGWVPTPDWAYPLLAVTVLSVELWLAWALWRTPSAWKAGVVLHAAIWLGTTKTVVHGFRLAVFALLVLALYPAFTTLRKPVEHRQTAPAPHDWNQVQPKSLMSPTRR